MGNMHPSFRAAAIDTRPLQRTIDHPSVDALIEENKQLRELVVQLSKIVVRNVLNRSH